jgi:predicted nucleic acid-binding protein
LSVYADTSFFVSLYIPDSNSVQAAIAMERLPLPVLISPLGELEMVNSLQLRLFRKELRPAEIRAAYGVFRDDLQSGVLALKPLAATVYAQAARLASKWTASLGTRTLDIIHVTCALALKVDTFSTFDQRQRSLAKVVGLQTTS